MGRWVQPGTGVDAVSAVTPGHVSVVGARQLPDVFDATAADSLVRRAFYFSGGVHRAFDGDAGWVLIRIAPVVDTAYQESHLQILESALLAIHEAAGEADLAVLVGRLDDIDDTWEEAIQLRLGNSRLAPLDVEILLVSEEETEAIDVPDGGVAVDLYDLPIALLECDVVISIAHAGSPLGTLKNLNGLARPILDSPDEADALLVHEVLVDQALLAEVSFTLAHVQQAGSPQILLASRDPVAIDRVAIALTGAASDSSSLAALYLANTRLLGQADLADIKVSGMNVPGTWVPADDQQ